MLRFLLLLAQSAPGGEAPWWLGAIVTPAVGFWLLATGHLRWGKGVDASTAQMAERFRVVETQAADRVAEAEQRAARADDRAEQAYQRERATLAQVLPVLESSSRLLDRVMDRATP